MLGRLCHVGAGGGAVSGCLGPESCSPGTQSAPSHLSLHFMRCQHSPCPGSRSQVSFPRGGYNRRAPERRKVPEADWARHSLRTPGDCVLPEEKQRRKRGHHPLGPSIPGSFSSLCTDPPPSLAPFQGGLRDPVWCTGEETEGATWLGRHQGPRGEAEPEPGLDPERQQALRVDKLTEWARPALVGGRVRREGAEGGSSDPLKHGPHLLLSG